MKVIYEDMEYLAEKHLTCFSQLENKRILITGSTGMIMSYMSEFLVRLNKKYKLNMIIYLQGKRRLSTKISPRGQKKNAARKGGETLLNSIIQQRKEAGQSVLLS